MKKLLTMVLCMVLIATLLCACDTTSKGSAGDVTTKAPSATNAAPTTTARKDPVTISFFGVDVRAIEGYSLRDGLWVWDELGKILNQKYEFNTTNDYWDLIDLRMFSGEKIEDLYCIGYNDMQKPAEEGLLTPLNDLINEYGPNIKKLMEDAPNKYVHSTSLKDGKIYAFSETVYRCSYVESVLMVGRKDWFDKLNLKAPETTDELFNALMTIKNGDPNGNGEQDEIPIGGSIGELEQYLAGSFGLHGVRNGFVWYDNGKAYMERTTENYKQLLMYLHDLYENELAFVFDGYPENTLAVTWTLFNAYEQNISGFLNDVPGAEAFGMLPPKGPDGKVLVEDYYTEAKRYIIPKDCEHPEEVVKLVDYLSSDEGWLLYEYGLEGQDYTMVDGEPVASDTYLTSGNMNGEYEKRGMKIQIVPRINPAPTKALIAARPAAINEGWSKLFDVIQPGYFLNQLPRTASETEALTNDDMNAYINDCMVKFVTGEMSFDRWDDFQAQLKKFGIDEMAKVYQTIYDRNYK